MAITAVIRTAYTKSKEKLPGAVTPGLNAYAASQALSWLVGTRHDLEDQVTRARDITTLIEKLLRLK
jgi:hypothetical protein